MSSLVIAAASVSALSGDYSALSFAATSGGADQKVTRYSLPNGMKVILAADPRFPNVGVNIWYYAGADVEPKGQRGIAHLVEHLMFESSPAVQSLGGHVGILLSRGVEYLNATTGRHRARYLTAICSSELDTVFWLEAARMASLGRGITREAFERERNIVMRELRERVYYNPYQLAERRLWERLFSEDNPYHYRVEGLAGDIASLGLDDVHRFIRKWYRPNNASIAVVGNFDKQEVIYMINRHFASIPPGEYRSDYSSSLVKQKDLSVAFTESIGRTRALLVGWSLPGAGGKDAEIGVLAAGILGGTSSRSLERYLVRELKLARRVDIRFTQERANSVLRIRVLLLPQTCQQEVLSAIYNYLSEFRPLDDKELLQLKHSYLLNRALGLDGIRGLLERAERLQGQDAKMEPDVAGVLGEITGECIRNFIKTRLVSQ